MLYVRGGVGVGVGVGMKLKGKGKGGRVETTRLKNLVSIEYGGGLLLLLLLLFVAVRGSAVWKFQHHCFPLWCAIFVSP